MHFSVFPLMRLICVDLHFLNSIRGLAESLYMGERAWAFRLTCKYLRLLRNCNK